MPLCLPKAKPKTRPIRRGMLTSSSPGSGTSGFVLSLPICRFCYIDVITYHNLSPFGGTSIKGSSANLTSDSMGTQAL